MQNLQEDSSDLEFVRDSFTMFVQFLLMEQLLNSLHLLRESGDDVTGSLV